MKFVSHIIKTVVLVSILFTFVGCSDEGADDFPFFIDAHESTIDLSASGEDGLSLISTTIFDDQGAPVDDGTMFFTMNSAARGSFSETIQGVQSMSIDIDDGVAEAVYYSTYAPETVVIKAYCPRYPSDATVSTSIRVINSTLQARFSVVADEDNGLAVYFYDESGFPDGTEATTTWAWTFGDGNTENRRGTADWPVTNFYAAAGTYRVTLTVNGTSAVYMDIIVE